MHKFILLFLFVIQSFNSIAFADFSLEKNVLYGLRFTPVPGSRIDHSGGLSVSLEKKEMPQCQSKVRHFATCGKCCLDFSKKDSATEQDLITHPERVIASIRKKEKKYPFIHLAECETCRAERTENPKIRERVENEILNLVSRLPKQDLLKLVIFGDSGLFQTLVLTQKITSLKQWEKIELHLIDVKFSHLIFADQEDADPKTYALRLKEILNWFARRSGIDLSISIYHHASRYVAASLERISPDLFISSDWIDELGYFGKGMVIQGDHLLTKLSLPPRTPIVDFRSPFGSSLVVNHRSEVESPISLQDLMHGSSAVEGLISRWMINQSTKEEEKKIESLFTKPSVFLTEDDWKM